MVLSQVGGWTERKSKCTLFRVRKIGEPREGVGREAGSEPGVLGDQDTKRKEFQGGSEISSVRCHGQIRGAQTRYKSWVTLARTASRDCGEQKPNYSQFQRKWRTRQAMIAQAYEVKQETGILLF